MLKKCAFGMVFILLVLGLAACGGSDENTGDQAEESAEPTATTEESAPTSEPEATATDEPEATEDQSSGATPAETTESETPAETADATATRAESTATEESGSVSGTSDTGTRTIEHTAGTTDIEGTPETIVALEWTYAEDLLALGVQPAGVADVEGYKNWVNVEPELSSDVVDVGTRQEPSLESISELNPDLIIGVQFRHEAIYEDLSEIAPTLLFNPYPTDQSVDQLTEMRQTLTKIAQAIGKPDEATTVLDEMESKFAEAQQALESAGMGGSEFVLVQAFTSQDQPQMRVFTDNAMAARILESIGLSNAWEGEFNQYGYNTVGIEALTTVEQANFLYVVQEDDNPFENQWGDNPVWKTLAFVEEDRTYALGGNTWLFGGPLSAELIADKVVTLLTE